MPLYRYIKTAPQVSFPVTAISLLSIHKNKLLIALSYVLILTGTFLIGNAVLPIVAYELIASKDINQTPIPTRLVYSVKPPPPAQAQSPPDLTDASNWFPANGKENIPRPQIAGPDNIEFYTLTIPKLGIKNATVAVGGKDLNRSLIQYKGTANPGQLGNPVIFGHSILPQFFNPKNYISIFSTLPTLKPKDIIFVNYDGIEYKYEVTELKEVKPTELSILEQRYDRKELSLVTCVPPGTYLRHLVVQTKLVENEK